MPLQANKRNDKESHAAMLSSTDTEASATKVSPEMISPRSTKTSSTPRATYTAVSTSQDRRGQPAPIGWRLRLAALFRNAGVSFLASWYLSWRYPGGEEPKVIISKDLLSACIRCWIHVLPMIATMVLIGLNLKGFFIGEQLSGESGGTFQAVDQLMLQICAKVIEMLVVASLGKVVIDLVRYELLYSEHGLPLGVMLARLQFSDISYFWSASFWSSCRAIPGRARRLCIAIVILLCGLIAAFAGPTSALLLIPATTEDWHGGGADFWLNGNRDTLWPSVLDADHAGGSRCASPTAEMLQTAPLNTSGCAWNGYVALSEFFKSTHLSPGVFNLTLTDGTIERGSSQYSGTPAGWEWSYTGHAAIGLYVSNIVRYWLQAIVDAPVAQGRHFSNGNYKWMTRWNSYSVAESLIPAVRTKCTYWGEYSWTNVGNLDYPYFEPFGAPDYSKSYHITGDFPTSSQPFVQTQWITRPNGDTQLIDGNTTNYYPSTFLTVQLPSGTPADTSILYTCTVDARWAAGRNFFPDPLSNLQRSELTHIDSDERGALITPQDDGSWKNVTMDLSWLTVLAPQIGSDRTNYTTIAAILDDFGATNDTGLIGDFGDLRIDIESIIAKVFADGMSRVGYSDNGGNLNHTQQYLDQYPPLPSQSEELTSVLNDLVTGHARLLSSAGDDPTETTKLRWDIYLSGYAYKADNAATQFAIVVLLAYAAIVGCHVIYMIATQLSSDAWEDAADLLALASLSPPPPEPVLANTSGGVRRNKTTLTMAGIRTVHKEKDAAREELHLIFDDHNLAQRTATGHDYVQYNTAYGAL